jgi:ABC-type lipoprotein export system ATPase subunit
MLTYIYVDGFRSLSDFKMEIRPGLNILIGPNGSGKSNIISFFQFLSRLMRSGLNDAVSLTGGAGAFFQKVGEASFKNEVRVEVQGLTSFTVSAPNRPSDVSWLQYKYTFTVQASDRFDSIVFANQKLCLKNFESQPTLLSNLHLNEDWELVLESSADPPSVFISCLKESWTNANRWPSSFSKTELDELLKRGAEAAQSTSLVQMMPYPGFEAMHYVAGDLFGGETLNINPVQVKEPEDSARDPGIRSDGSGLAATLWHMRNEPPYPGYFWGPSSFTRRRWPREVADQLQSLIRIVNPQIERVDVINEPFDNLLKIKVRMASKKDTIDLPLSAMSDGTIKWASLITAILTSRAIIAIEEPENFLHPLMLIEILKLMRTTTMDKLSFVIMTTHSETLLNAAHPNEVIVVSMDDGVTCGRRPHNPEQLAKEIRETGFGLGHYYLAGDLGDA